MKWAWPAILAFIMIFAAASPPSPAAAQSNVIQIIPDPEMIGPATKMTVLIVDGGLDANPNRIDEYEAEDVELVTFTTDRSEVGEAVVDLEETGENSGIFEFTIQLKTDGESCDSDLFTGSSFDAEGGSDPSIGVCPGDVLSIEYEDPLTASGEEGVISSSVEIRSWDPEFVANEFLYLPGDRIVVNITDPDANRDPDIADSIRDIKVYSDSDMVGEEFSALETGDNTGVFTLAFTTSLQAQGNAILVKDGDEAKVEYTDEFPEDFAASTAEKTFIFGMLITFPHPIESFRSSVPEIAANGAPTAGKQATLSLVVTNDADHAQQFVELVEVRDSSGVTVFLAWQSGTLDSNSQTQIGVSWIPERPGDYIARMFAISDFDNPQVLSQVSESDFTIE
jgi:hypothetical protein